MKKYTMILTLLFALASGEAFAGGPWLRWFQLVKPVPAQAVMEHQLWVAPLLGSATLLKSAAALNNGSATTISTFLAQPDFARNIVLTVGGTAASVAAGTAVVTGTSISGAVISENFAISLNQAGATTGAKAFKSVVSVVFPATTGAGATLSIGSGAKLGLPRCVANAGDYDWSEFGGVFDATRGTLAVSASAMESNTFQSNSALNGSSNVDLFYVQNYGCF